jgi:hypothetical protein
MVCIVASCCLKSLLNSGGKVAFLNAVARKAGLPRFDPADPDARVFVFGAEVLEEKER